MEEKYEDTVNTIHNVNVHKQYIFNVKKYIELSGMDIQTDNVSDGSHTFGDLYEQRRVLFAALTNVCIGKSWKSKKHSDGIPCFGGDWFVVGIDTPEGTYTYHYEMKYWDLFKCKEIEKAPEWDGHSYKDIKRLLSL